MTVLLRRSALGDVVLLGAVTSTIQGPVTVVTDSRYVSLAARLKGVDRAVSWPDDAASLPAGRLVDLQGSMGSRRLTWRRWPRRLHKRSLRRRMRLWWGLGNPRPAVPSIYAEACGVRPAAPPWFDLPEHRAEALVLAPGAAWATKRWPAAGFAEVGRRWEGPVVVIGGPGEEALCEGVAAGIPGADCVVEAGFDRALDVMARAAVVVAGDTGLMHLGGACGVPVVAVFGPTHPDDGFFVYPGEVVQQDLGCRPCTLHRQPECPRGDHACMNIAPEAVLDAVRRAWAG